MVCWARNVWVEERKRCSCSILFLVAQDRTPLDRLRRRSENKIEMTVRGGRGVDYKSRLRFGGRSCEYGNEDLRCLTYCVT